jgi:hypothetical protein
MAKYKIAIRLIETYENKVVVEAANLDEAIKKVEEEWESDTYLYEDTIDMMEDQDVQFYKCGLASDTDIKHCINID